MSQNPSTGQAAQTAKSAVMRTTKIPSFVLLLVLGGLQLLALPNAVHAGKGYGKGNGNRLLRFLICGKRPLDDTPTSNTDGRTTVQRPVTNPTSNTDGRTTVQRPVTNHHVNRGVLYDVLYEDNRKPEVKSLGDLMENCENPRIFEASKKTAYICGSAESADAKRLVAYQQRLSRPPAPRENISDRSFLDALEIGGTFPSLDQMKKCKNPAKLGRMLMSTLIKSRFCEQSTEAHGTVYKPNKKWYSWSIIKITRTVGSKTKELWVLADSPKVFVLKSVLTKLIKGRGQDEELDWLRVVEHYYIAAFSHTESSSRPNMDSTNLEMPKEDGKNTATSTLTLDAANMQQWQDHVRPQLKSQHEQEGKQLCPVLLGNELDIYSSLIRVFGLEENLDEKRPPNSDQPIKELPSHLLESLKIETMPARTASRSPPTALFHVHRQPMTVKKGHVIADKQPWKFYPNPKGA